jgi:hypothetical protein
MGVQGTSRKQQAGISIVIQRLGFQDRMPALVFALQPSFATLFPNSYTNLMLIHD